MSLLIRNAEIVTASDRFVADVKVEGETIAAIGRELPSESGDEIVDGSDQWLIPGGIDPHVHMALPFMGTVSIDDFGLSGRRPLDSSKYANGCRKASSPGGRIPNARASCSMRPRYTAGEYRSSVFIVVSGGGGGRGRSGAGGGPPP